MIAKSLACPVCGGSVAPGVRFLPDDVVELTLARKPHRFLHQVLDGLICVALWLALGTLMAALPQDVREHPAALLFLPLLPFAMWLGYYIAFEHLQGRTPSHRVTGSWVVTDVGGRPALRIIVGRTFARLIPFDGLAALADPLGIALHDRLSGTRVVRAPDVR